MRKRIAGIVGRDPQEVLAPGRVRRVRADRRAARHAVRRAGPAVAFVSVGFFLFYYLCLVGGEELANRLLLPPWLAMWLPNIVLGIWGVDWTLKACELRRSRHAPAASGSRPRA